MATTLAVRAHHAQPAHDGGRRHALRHHDGAGRRLEGRLGAAARSGVAPRRRAMDDVVASRRGGGCRRGRCRSALVGARRRRRCAGRRRGAARRRTAGTPAIGCGEACAATRRRLVEQLDAVARRGADGRRTRSLGELEEALIGGRRRVRTTAGELVERVRERLGAASATPRTSAARSREELEAVLAAPPAPEPSDATLGHPRHGRERRRQDDDDRQARGPARGARDGACCSSPADTFRAAAIDQLAVWAERTGAELVRQAPGADPSAVVFDGMKAARGARRRRRARRHRGTPPHADAT